MKKKHRGFTLIELIASILLFSIMGLYTWISINTSFKTKKTVDRYANLYEQASAVSEKITLDLSQMFLIPSNQNLTFLQGKEDEITFTSLSHAPLTSTAKESEQTEITYKTENNENRRGLKLLLRNETRFIDGALEKKEDENFETLTGQLESISFEYSKDGVAYIKDWDTTSRDQKDQLPKIIKLSLTFKEGIQSSTSRDDNEVFLESFIDIPMSDFYTPKSKNQQGDQNANTKGSNQKNNQNSNNQNNQPGTGPFGIGNI